MDRNLLVQGGLKSLGSVAITIPTTSGGTPVFAAPPAGTALALVTVRAFPMTVTFDGTVPTAGAVGTDYGVPSTQAPYDFPLTPDDLKRVKGIGNGGSATLYIQYWGIP